MFSVNSTGIKDPDDKQKYLQVEKTEPMPVSISPFELSAQSSGKERDPREKCRSPDLMASHFLLGADQPIHVMK